MTPPITSSIDARSPGSTGVATGLSRTRTSANVAAPPRSCAGVDLDHVYSCEAFTPWSSANSRAGSPLARHFATHFAVTASDSRVWSFLRRHAPAGGPNQTLLIAINLSGATRATTLNLSGYTLPSGGSPATDLVTGQAQPQITAANQGAYSISIPRYSYRILTVDLTPPPPPVSRVDGINIPTSLASPLLTITQNTPTALGDNVSELNQLLLRADPDGLLVGISGNLQNDGTALALFFDTVIGGQNIVETSAQAAPPGGLSDLTGLRFDAGFNADRLFFINAPSGTFYTDQVNLVSGSSTKTYRGNGTVNSGHGLLTGGTNPNGLQVAFNNTNTAGITSSSVAGAATATKGFEILIPYADLGLATPFCGTLGVSAFIVRSTGEVTQQWLPGLSGLSTNPGAAPNMTTIAGTQHARTLTPPPSCTHCQADFDGDGDVGTDLDIEAFFACLGGNCCATCGSPDFDGDGDTGTDLDIESFFRVMGGGAC